jgi:hypothetical protein
MLRTQISFDRSLYLQARREAHRRGVSLAELCRRGLCEILAREGGQRTDKWMRHAGSVCSGDPHASENVDQVVYGRNEP